MSTTTSMATTTGTAASSTTSTCPPSYEYPKGFSDAACAAVVSGNITDIFDHCCKGDAPTTYNDGCNIYCLAQNQNVGDLTHCLINSGARPVDVFCQPTNGSATATVAPSTTADSTSTGTATGTKTSGATSTSTKNAAIGTQPITKTGLGVVAMVFCSALMGVLA
ncbi:hypothetical protein N7468_008848 [Penicillium chermesinum]|uniref:Uncharacterized protein n=1 Tax=Penicillium chermesinum TaxID=63820 RepID=A0A9W9NGP6_9EURO|nr:uncharacterized protein N7468_008848 [Penicillium chermesinum]KAJ5219644.1 hypothetical protein N7468_008848 [Penicillium chermesinum]KAJ6153650.1 hypothetical protein N7470_006609 [Penicillium chermesinum]